MTDQTALPKEAAVIGATGGIGAAFARALAADPDYATVHAFSRSGKAPEGCRAGPLDLCDEETIRAAAETITDGALRLCIVATGILHNPAFGPEKNMGQLAPGPLAETFAINAIGPALVAKHFLPRMPRRDRAVFAALSARVGSISDNRMGGWYGYRASKAALNQMLKCLAIETGRKRRETIIVGLQPGTVATGLSAPFRGNVPGDRVFEPDEAAGHLLGVLGRLEPAASGRVFDWSGEEVPA